MSDSYLPKKQGEKMKGFFATVTVLTRDSGEKFQHSERRFEVEGMIPMERW